ncbi:MAG: EVE domain-containing protein [Alphaproteobacteria bacterium]|nr:EVE domain-containing protein [Alphaproteobacteria bacterium]
MAFWLVKSEPETWSWQAQVNRGAAGEPWDGVRNHQANNNLKAMAVGDRAFFYHSGEERRIVGIVEVIKPWWPDPKDETGKFGMVRVKAVAKLPTPVTLAAIKAEPDLADLLLVRHSRLSVMPVAEPQWRLICRMGSMA